MTATASDPGRFSSIVSRVSVDPRELFVADVLAFAGSLSDDDAAVFRSELLKCATRMVVDQWWAVVEKSRSAPRAAVSAAVKDAPLRGLSLRLPTIDTPVAKAAELYADLGFKPVPLYGVVDGRCTCTSGCGAGAAGKHPIGTGWEKLASCDVDRVRERFRNHAGNVGIMLGPQFVCIDADGPEGMVTLATLNLPPTLTARSGSGGEHRIFRYAKHQDPTPVANRRFADHLDCKTNNGQIVAAPSLHKSGGRYEWISTGPEAEPIAELPGDIYDMLRDKPKPQRPAPVFTPSTDRPDQTYRDRDVLLLRLREYIKKHEPAIAGSGGHTACFAAARSCVKFLNMGIGEGDCFAVLRSFNETHCVPPFSEHDLLHKWNQAKTKGVYTDPVENRPRSDAHPSTAARHETRASASADFDEETGEVFDTPTIPTEPEAELVPISRVSVSTTDTKPATATGLRLPEPDWRSRLLFEQTRQGLNRLAKHAENIIVILRYCPEWKDVVRWNSYEQHVTITNPPWHISDRNDKDDGERGTRQWSDDDSLKLSAWVRREFGVDIAGDQCDKASVVAAKTNPYNPVQDYFSGLDWDGIPRLAKAPSHYFGCAYTPYAALVFRWWMIAAVARTYHPGTKVDNVLILEGEQGLRKSTALKVLAGEWFSDTPIDLRSKDAYLALQGRLIVELAELESLKKSDADRAKTFFSSGSDSYRPPYGRHTVTIPRTAVFAGTVNHGVYLADPTGGRRYWPLACTAIDIDALRQDRDQLWAEAVDQFHSRALWYPSTPEEVELCSEEQADRAEDDAWEADVHRYLTNLVTQGKYTNDPNTWPTTNAIMTGALNLTVDKFDKSAQTRVGNILQKLGYVRFRPRVDGERAYRYAPPKPKKGAE